MAQGDSELEPVGARGRTAHLQPNMMLRNMRVTSSTLDRMNLDHCVINASTFFNSLFAECTFAGAAFAYGTFDGSTIENCSLRGVEIKGCDVTGLVINGVDIGKLLRSASDV